MRQAWTEALIGRAIARGGALGFSQSSEHVAATAKTLRVWMLAEAQDHILEGGDDLLSGGPLSELLDFRPGEAGRDRVADFEIWDRLQFTGFGVAYGTDPRQHLRQTEIDVLFDYEGVVVELSGLQLDDLQDGNILF